MTSGIAGSRQQAFGRYRWALLFAAVIFAALPTAFGSAAAPLWPGAKYTTEDRDRAVEHGLRFIYSVAKDPAAFRENGSDLLFAFENIATTNANPRLALLARRMGRERAVEWRRQHHDLPAKISADAVSDLIYGSTAAARLGVPDPAFDRLLRTAAAKFSAVDYLGFDAAREPPPSDVPEPCRICGLQNARGAQYCARCGAKLSKYNRYDLFMFALVTTYFGEQAGVSLGGPYRDVLRWLPQMRPYPPHRYNDWNYYDALYAITHVVYTFNHYNQSRILPACFPAELEYLKTNLPAAIRDHDPETLGEYVDSLRAFGMTYADARLREAVEYLLSTQNSDGSWGDPADKSVYNRYHTTWAAQGAIQEFRWTGVVGCTAAAASKH